ncbi:hypothetical protein WCE37_07335 [Luteimonas sp. MJ250]|uniref:hypothetical protein n=1 Tax=Luteimonas sp. MJ250 TaxID=3129236 RepID=UPI0031BB895E
MKRYPLQTLVRLREHRTEAARQQVLERQREAQACRDACLKVEGEIIALDFEQKQHRARMLDPPPPGVPWPGALAQREAHIDLLGEQAEAARQRLFKAQETLRAAEAAVAEARTAFFRAQARLDALQKRRDVWRGEQSVLEVREEENAAEDLLQARHLAGA